MRSSNMSNACVQTRDITLGSDTEEGLDPTAQAHGGPPELKKADKTRRRITFEALDSGPPDVANVGNPGDVCLAFLLRGETPRHSWLIPGRRALSDFIVLI
jgi:hypothetical protein